MAEVVELVRTSGKTVPRCAGSATPVGVAPLSPSTPTFSRRPTGAPLSCSATCQPGRPGGCSRFVEGLMLRRPICDLTARAVTDGSPQLPVRSGRTFSPRPKDAWRAGHRAPIGSRQPLP